MTRKAFETPKPTRQVSWTTMTSHDGVDTWMGIVDDRQEDGRWGTVKFKIEFDHSRFCSYALFVASDDNWELVSRFQHLRGCFIKAEEVNKS